jgi:hypothetical protein
LVQEQAARAKTHVKEEAAKGELDHAGEKCTSLKKTLGILSEPPSNGINGSTR